MKQIDVKSLVGQAEAHNGEIIVAFTFISSTPSNNVVLLGEGTLYELFESVRRFYDVPGRFQIAPRPSSSARQHEFETLGRGHENYPAESVIKTSKVTIHLETPVLGIEFHEGGSSTLFIFDLHSLGEFREQLQQMNDALRRLPKK